MSRKLIPFTAAISFAILGAGCAKQSGEPRVSTQAPTSRDADVRAYINPDTGELREPTPAELAAEAAVSAAKKKELSAARNLESGENAASREVTTPSGAVELTLDRSNDTSLKGCVAPNGDIKMEHDCPAATNNEKKK